MRDAPEPFDIDDPFLPIRSWEDALARFEADLQAAIAHTDPMPWRPPIALGPIPDDLLERAAHILEAQLYTTRYLEDVRQTTARHLAAVRAVDPTNATPHPVYFDLMG